MRTFTIVHPSPLGDLLISGNDSFISGVRYADLHQELEKKAVSTNNAPALLRRCATHLDEYFAGWRRTFGLQFQQEGTLFQQTVWQGLLKIPFGQTNTYADLARQIGNAKSSRAVGLANGKNQIAIIVPCHRIIGTSGNLTGYNGGMWRKKWLLDHEKRIAHGVLSLF
ncbi:methylated-DNA--[protein]-cysteine S-methyltransferase [Tunicatimonas pelagia]|uniref:methylated-DNA--[protein]-cysteine S-methyltransferase n=1 Tax=Tunicatimonas pelagia TaxID=931531 RepID=UPI0026652C8F|nr:methylated-DNA--[protein]-cysteine S-methyltransferase [Tunicatimonas pelagia]WKN45123.1 methylated-DNA--[protein]-cysteine S-methyltransferase [Tunicatimonas pelagia]